MKTSLRRIVRPLWWWILLIPILFTNCSIPRINSQSEPFSHALWDSLLLQYVDEYGLVNYAAWQRDTLPLQHYLDLLRQNHPNNRNWTSDEQLAYWINAYNAFTVELILEHYPLQSIKDIKKGIPFVNTVWDIRFITIEGKTFDLNNIEHGIIRKQWDDPRVHFALVCASMSCPKLQNRAFVADQLDRQLDAAARAFFTEPYRNEVSSTQLRLSKILDWYWMDFKDRYDSRATLVRRYSELDIPDGVATSFLEYDWSLNEQTAKKRALLGRSD